MYDLGFNLFQLISSSVKRLFWVTYLLRVVKDSSQNLASTKLKILIFDCDRICLINSLVKFYEILHFTILNSSKAEGTGLLSTFNKLFKLAGPISFCLILKDVTLSSWLNWEKRWDSPFSEMPQFYKWNRLIQSGFMAKVLQRAFMWPSPSLYVDKLSCLFTTLARRGKASS